MITFFQSNVRSILADMLIDHSNFKNIRITNASIVYEVLVDIRKGLHPFEKDKEYCYCLGLSRNNSIKYIDLVSIGSISGTIVAVPELYRFAIHKAVAGGIILAHNHPSGNLKPSTSDFKITKQIKKAGEIIGIKLLDHVIFSDEGFYSFVNEDAFDF